MLLRDRICIVQRCSFLVVVLFVVVCFGMPSSYADETTQQKLIRQLIEQLDAKTFIERQAASRQLHQLGSAALPALLEAMQSESPEVARRARDIVLIPLHRQLDIDFRTFAKLPEDKLDVEDGMFLIARIGNPFCQRATIDRELDALAAKVKVAFGKRDPHTANPQFVVEKITGVLFYDENFRGNTENYQHPDNSSIESVLATRKGLPILLSHVVVAVARRLDLPIVGIGVRSRYMAKYEGDVAPVGFPRRDVFMDPFGGRVIQQNEIARIVGAIDPDVDLVPSTTTKTLVRMLSNLKSHFFHVGEFEKGELTTRYYDLLSTRLQDADDGSNPFK